MSEVQCHECGRGQPHIAGDTNGWSLEPSQDDADQAMQFHYDNVAQEVSNRLDELVAIVAGWGKHPSCDGLALSQLMDSLTGSQLSKDWVLAAAIYRLAGHTIEWGEWGTSPAGTTGSTPRRS